MIVCSQAGTELLSFFRETPIKSATAHKPLIHDTDFIPHFYVLNLKRGLVCYRMRCVLCHY